MTSKEFRSLHRIQRIFIVNVWIATASIVGLWFLGKVFPWDFLFAAGISWVFISTIESLRTLRNMRNDLR